MSAGFRAGQANDGYLQINGTDILSVSSGILGVKNTGAQSEVRLYCESNNAHYASLKSPPHSDFIGNVTFTLPGTSGSSGQVLQTDGSGNLSWVNNSGGGGGGGVSDKMSEGNTEAEVVDTGSDGHFKVTTEGVERLRVTSDGKIGIINSDPLYAMHFKNAMGSSPSFIHMEVTGSNTVGGGGGIAFDTSASNNASNNSLFLATISGVRTSADDGSNDLVFKTSKSLVDGDDGVASTPKEKLRITSDGELVSTNGTLRRDVSTSSFTVTGDTASNTGANINLYGANHSSLANIFRVRTGATERLRVGPSGQIGLGGANYGTSGQVLTSGGASGAVSWTTISGGGGGSYGNSDVDNHLNSGGASSGQILSWNGSDYAWVADQGGSGGGGISDLVDDTTPQLGGNLDLNSNNITGTGTIPAANLIGTLPAISGASLTTLNASELDSGTIPDARFPATLPAVSGANLTNLPAANITGTLPAISGANLTNLPGISNVVEDTSPQLGGNLNVNGSDIISTGNGDIDFTPNGTGAVVFKGVSSNGGNGAGRFKLNCENNSHGITIQGPPHSAAANYTLTLPNNDGSSGEYLKSDGSGNLSWSNPLISTGNVGIGIASPTAKLEVTGESNFSGTHHKYQYSDDCGILVKGNESAIDILGSDAGNHGSSILLRNATEGFGFVNDPGNNVHDGALVLKSFTTTADDFSIHGAGSLVTNLVDIVTFTKAGNIGINQYTPTAKLQVDQEASDQSGAAALKVVGTAYGTNKSIHSYMGTTSNTKSLFYAENSNGVVMNVAGNGYIGIGATNNTSYDSNAQNVLIASDGNTGITIRSAGSTPFAMIHFADGTTGNSQKRAGRIVYQHDGDNLAFNTADTERLRITGDGDFRISVDGSGGTSSQQGILRFYRSGYSDDMLDSRIVFDTSLYSNSTNSGTYAAVIAGKRTTEDNGSSELSFYTCNSSNSYTAQERLRITSGGNLLVNTATSRSVMDHVGNGPTPKIQIEATNSDAIMSIISAGTADANRCGTINLGRHRNGTVGATPTIVNDNDALGAVVFSGGDGGDMLTAAAKIHAEVDGTPGANDMPGALVFSTTPDGQGHANNTERLRITSGGLVRVPDNGKFTAGAGDDLQIYHTGSHSFIEDTGTGGLYIRGGGQIGFRDAENSFANMANFNSGGSIDLYYNGSKRFETVSAGVKITSNLYLGGSLNGGFSYNSTANTLEFMMTNGSTHSELTHNAYVPSATATRHLGYHNKRWDKVFCDGVRFGGDNTDATTLDDYEEGTFSPALHFGGSNTGMSYGANTGGSYTKVGRMVYVHIRLELTSKGSSTGAAVIPNLPFVVGNIQSGASSIEQSCAIGGYQQNAFLANSTNIRAAGCKMMVNTNDLELTFNDFTTGDHSDMSHANFDNNASLSFDLMYQV